MDPRSVRRLLAGLAVMVCAGPARATIISVDSVADTVADDGQCTLREAITAANENKASGVRSGECSAGDPLYPGVPYDIINFNIRGTAPFVISPTTPLPYVTEAVSINGYSQPGARPNTLASGSDAVLMLELRGDNMTPACDLANESPVAGAAFQFVGLRASGSRLRGFALTGLRGHDAAVVIFRARGVQIDGNFIGFDTKGQPLENDGNGIVVLNGAYDRLWGTDPTTHTWIDDGGPGNLIGGTSPQERNVIGGGRMAVQLGGQRNRVEGNYIGVDPQGLQSFPPRLSVVVAGNVGVQSCQYAWLAFHFLGEGNTIGGARGGNFFSAESSNCAVMLGAAGNVVDSNWIGTDRDGGPGSGLGLGVQPGCGVLVQGTASVAGNTITYNRIAYAGKGVVVRTSSSSSPGPIANDIRANSIHSNLGQGIDLGDDWVTANDTLDGDSGANGLQNFPEKLTATLVGVRGVVRGKPSTQLRLDFYQNRRCDPSGNGQGEEYLGSTSVITDPHGQESFNVSLPGLQLERVVVATATSVADGTSEFSACARVLPGQALTVDVQSSRNPVRSHEPYTLTVSVNGLGVPPTGTVQLVDTAHTTVLPGGQTVFHVLDMGTIAPVTAGSSTAVVVFDSKRMRRTSSEWGNLHVRAQYLGDATYAATDSADLVQQVYREKSDLDGDGLSDLVLCDGSNAKFLVQDIGGTFKLSPLSSLGTNRTVLGTGEFGAGSDASIVWRDTSGTIGITTFAGGVAQRDFTVPLPPGLTFEGLGSMYGDLKDDFIVRDSSATSGLGWQHYGVLTALLGSGTLQIAKPWPIGQPNYFLVEQTGDFNADGSQDWHYRHSTVSTHVLWLIDSFKVIGGAPLAYVPAGGTVATTGDFDGDGRTDFVWSLPNGDTEIALQNGAMTSASVPLTTASTGQVIIGSALLDDGSGNATSGGRSSLIVRKIATGDLEAWINTGVSAGVPTFGVRAIPTNGITDLRMCVP